MHNANLNAARHLSFLPRVFGASMLAILASLTSAGAVLAQVDSLTPPLGKPIQGKGDIKRARVIRKRVVVDKAGQTKGVTVIDEQAASYDRAIALNKTFGLRGWNIPWPSFGETIDKDLGGYRTTLAKYGLSFLAYNSTNFLVNTLNTPETNKGTQVYNGQRPTYTNSSVVYLNYDLTRYGISDGQLQLASFFWHDSWKPLGEPNNALYRLAYYQTLLDHKLEVNFGFMSSSTVWVGNFLAGQIFNPFGPSSSIQSEVGLSTGPTIQPIAFADYHADNFYDIFGAARSINTSASSVLNEGIHNPAFLRFSEPGQGTVFVNEIGYKTAASDVYNSTWLRGGAAYNDSQSYHNYKNNTNNNNNYAAYFLADRQFTKIGDTSRGIYGGVSAFYAPPAENIYSQYYEARIYAVGIFASRPQDTISGVFSHNVISSAYADPINTTSLTTLNFAAHATNTVTVTYNCHVIRGLYVTVGVAYTDHPSVSYIPYEGRSLNFLASSFVVF